MTQTHNTSYTPVRSDATARVRFDDQAKSLGQAPAPRPRGLCTAWPQCPHTKHISSLAAAAATSTTATGSPRAISHVGCGALHPSLRTWRTNPSLRTIRSQHSAHRTRCAHILSPPRHTLSRARRLTRVTLPRSSHFLPPGTCSSSQRPPQPARGASYHYTAPRVVVNQRRRHRGSVSFAPSLTSPCVRCTAAPPLTSSARMRSSCAVTRRCI